MTTTDTTSFVPAADSGWIPTDPGIRRRVLAHNDALMIVEFDFEKDAVGRLHDHPHVQASYVAQGRFEITIGETTRVLAAGDSFIVPSGVTHGVKALEPGRLVDSFAPARADFID